MKLAILGGTFDPPHIGHFFLAEVCVQELKYSRVLFIPASIPAHKTIESGTGAGDRMAMLERETERLSFAAADDMEIRRGGVSYSIDTVRALKQRYPDMEGKPGLVIGDDLLPGFHEWKEAEALTAEADVIIARRLPEKIENIPFPHVYLDNPVLPVSSREIRERITAKKAYRYLVTEKIYAYIREKHLYGA
jgi:nicotinate-nucleotide adenylyltransferase